MAMLAVVWMMISAFLVLMRNGARSREKRKINRLFAEPVWACWGFNQDELAPGSLNQGLLSPFRIWFGRNGVYHELIGFTPLDRKLISVEYRENYTPAIERTGKFFRHKEYRPGWVSIENGLSGQKVLKALRPLERLGDSGTPKLEFGINDGDESSNWTTCVYFPVPRGCESDGKALVQRYQLERHVPGRPLS